MRYLRMFALHLQDVFQNRGRAFIYFLMGLFNPLLFLLFWSGAIAEQKGDGSYWSLGEMSSYYLLVAVTMSFLIVHIDEDVAFHDIKEGVLSKYLLRPFSYFIFKFMEELPWRLAQGFFALLVFIVFALFFHISFPFVSNPLEIGSAIIICVLALCISYTLKMILGLTALWTTDYWGTLSINEVALLVFGGIVMPFTFYPDLLAKIAYTLPLAYIIYFPVVALQGKLSWVEIVRVITTQIIWVGLLYGLFQIIWKRGIKRFTAVGQ